MADLQTQLTALAGSATNVMITTVAGQITGIITDAGAGQDCIVVKQADKDGNPMGSGRQVVKAHIVDLPPA